MANDLNSCNFIGRLGAAPEIRYMPNGNAVASFNLAVNESWANKQTGQKEERTEWVSCSVFGKLAEVCGQYLTKGSQVYVSCRMRTEKWQDQAGQDRYTTKMIVQNMQMLGGGNRTQQGEQPHQPTQQMQQPQQQPQQQGATQPQYNESSMDFDDDLPFAPIGLMYSNTLIHCI